MSTACNRSDVELAPIPVLLVLAPIAGLPTIAPALEDFVGKFALEGEDRDEVPDREVPREEDE